MHKSRAEAVKDRELQKSPPCTARAVHRRASKISYFRTSSADARNGTTPCSSPWLVISSPTAGYRAAADINADELVNGVDLASVLGNWGDAPRVPFPPSDCPLNLVNP